MPPAASAALLLIPFARLARAAGTSSPRAPQRGCVATCSASAVPCVCLVCAELLSVVFVAFFLNSLLSAVQNVMRENWNGLQPFCAQAAETPLWLKSVS